jgi:hypothetical protein
MNPELLSGMLEGCWDFAKLMLTKSGDFFPFGETADDTGQRTMQAADIGQAHPRPQELYAFLEGALRQAAAQGEIAAVALAANVNIPAEYKPQFPDGIRVHVEATGYSRYVYLPYQVSPRNLWQRLRGRPHEVIYGETFSVEVPPLFFRAGTG